MSADTPLQAAADQLIAAIQAHAAAATSSEPFDAETLTIAVHEALTAYDHVVEAETGFSPVFGFGGEELLVDDEEEVLAVPDDVERLSVVARWDFIVRDEAAVREYVRGRLLDISPRGSEGLIDGRTATAEDAVHELPDLDGWDVEPYTEHGLELAGAGWTTQPVDRTLGEMTPDEREASGF